MHDVSLSQSAYRALLTDTLPYEVPVIFSNDRFFLTIARLYEAEPSSVADKDVAVALRKIVDLSVRYTIPYNYDIIKSRNSWTRLSVIHPSIQMEFCKFYRDHSRSILASCAKSRFSIRYPIGVADVFVRKLNLQDGAEQKEGRVHVDTEDEELSRVISYFGYGRYNLLGKFIESQEFLRLEKRFSKMRSADISKCFFNIYTHSVTWAVKDKTSSKANANMYTFEGRFDKIMQRTNYNETNGIVVGPEVSRIFAEIIFQNMDKTLHNRLLLNGMNEGRDYAIRRYVDDYFIFSNTDETLGLVEATLRRTLEEYKLFINENKLATSERPFVSGISLARREVSRTLDELKAEFANLPQLTSPDGIRRHRQLVGRSLQDLRLVVSRHGVEMGNISGWFLSALKYLLAKVCRADLPEPMLELVPIVSSLLDLAFYVCAVDLRVRSTYNLCQIVAIIARWSRRLPLDSRGIIDHKIQEEITLVLKSMFATGAVGGHDSLESVEMYNLLICGAQFVGEEFVRSRDIKEILSTLSSMKPVRYFRYIAIKFCMLKYQAGFQSDITALNAAVKDRILNGATTVQTDTETFFLFCDYVSAPGVSHADRRAVFDGILKGTTSNQTITRVAALLTFSDWSGVRIEHLLRRKELRPVYAWS